MGGKSQNYQQCVQVEVNLTYNIVWVAKKEAFLTIRHNSLRGLTAKILLEVCSDTKIEPKLVLLSGEDWSNWTANRSNETRLDVWACSFWERGASIFWLKGVQPQRLPLSQQIVATMSRYERKWEENCIQWKSTTNRPWHIYAIGFLHLWKHGWRMP